MTHLKGISLVYSFAPSFTLCTTSFLKFSNILIKRDKNPNGDTMVWQKNKDERRTKRIISRIEKWIFLKRFRKNLWVFLEFFLSFSSISIWLSDFRCASAQCFVFSILRISIHMMSSFIEKSSLVGETTNDATYTINCVCLSI